MQENLVSVIIPVYNVENYIRESIKSIQNQTYKNLEIIVIDDGSTDNTFKILQELAKNDNRIKLYYNEKNLRIVNTLNRALNLANGTYIARMDGDDISALDRIEKKVKFLEENKEFALIGCSVIAIDTEGNKIGQTVYYSDQNMLFKSLKYATPVSHIWVARKSLYEKLNGYREIPGAEDYDFLLRMITSGYKFTNLEDFFGYFVRIARNGNTASCIGLDTVKLHSYVYRLYTERLKFGKDRFSTEDLKKYLKTNILFHKLHALSNKYLYKALKCRSEHKYLKMLFNLFISVISPYQVKYLFNRFMYRYIIWRNKK